MIYFLNTHGVFVLFIVVTGWLWFFEKSKESARHVLLAGVLAGVVALLLKELFDVPRPYVMQGLLPLAGYSVRTSSLPSMHTALAFALATTVALHQRKAGIILLLIAALIGFGRIIARVHYPVDVAVGAVIGTATSLIIENFHPRAKSRKIRG